MNSSTNTVAFRVTLSESIHSRIELLCLNKIEKTIHFFWIRRGNTMRKAYSFSQTSLARHKSPKKVNVTCVSRANGKWQKSYCFAKEEHANMFCEMIAPSVRMNCNFLNISYCRLFNEQLAMEYAAKHPNVEDSG